MSKKLLKSYHQLRDEWYQKLEAEGFHDIEKKSNQIGLIRNTQAFQNRDAIRDFFLALDAYLITAELKPLHRKILELYTQGIKITEIVRRVKRSRSNVKQIIYLHKREILYKK